jgi:hypothetical protein
MPKSMNPLLIVTLMLIGLLTGCNRTPRNAASAADAPLTEPDYNGVTIPPNIAPLNFCIKEKGTAFAVTISGKQGPRLNLRSAKGVIRIPSKTWRTLLATNSGDTHCAARLAAFCPHPHRRLPRLH